MKKVTILMFVLTLPLSAWGQVDLSILATINVEEIANCDKATVECQTKISNIQQLITALMLQVVAIGSTGGTGEFEISNNEEILESYGDDYYLRDSYQNGLKQDIPLSEGDKQKFGLRGLTERRLDLRGQQNGLAHPIYMEFWRLFSTMIPNEIIRDFDSVTFVNDPEANHAGSLYTKVKSSNNVEFELTFNLAFLNLKTPAAYNKSLEVIAHEAAHALSVNTEQFKFSVKRGDCEDDMFYLSVVKGCSEEGSYFENFSNFWDEDFRQHAYDMSRLDDKSEYEKAEKKRNIYYNNNQSSFVSDYAAHNLYEDFAESMMNYLMYQLPENTTTIADKKIVFFDQFAQARQVKQEVSKLKK